MPQLNLFGAIVGESAFKKRRASEVPGAAGGETKGRSPSPENDSLDDEGGVVDLDTLQGGSEPEQVPTESPSEDEAPPMLATVVQEDETTTAIVDQKTAKGCIQYDEVELDNNPKCSKCGYTVDPCAPGTRLVAKTPPSWKCRKCNVKHVSLVRMFGKWPVESFSDLSPEVQQRFWAEPDASAAGVKKSVQKYISSRAVEVELARLEGQFLPLGVWRKQGYDVEKIKQSARRESHPVLGDVYQVKIKSTSLEKRKELVREHMAKMISDGRALKDEKKKKKGEARSSTDARAAADPGSPSTSDSRRDNDDETSPSQSSSTSSSSESSSPPVKKSKRATNKMTMSKAARKTAKVAQKRKDKEKRRLEEERRKAQAEKANLLAEKKRVAKVRADCSKAVAKLSPVLVQIEDGLITPAFAEHTPRFAVQKLRIAHEHIKTIHEEAKSKLREVSPSPLSVSLPAVTDAWKAAAEAWKLSKVYIETAQKHTKA